MSEASSYYDLLNRINELERQQRRTTDAITAIFGRMERLENLQATAPASNAFRRIEALEGVWQRIAGRMDNLDSQLTCERDKRRDQLGVDAEQDRRVAQLETTVLPRLRDVETLANNAQARIHNADLGTLWNMVRSLQKVWDEYGANLRQLNELHACGTAHMNLPGSEWQEALAAQAPWKAPGRPQESNTSTAAYEMRLAGRAAVEALQRLGVEKDLEVRESWHGYHVEMRIKPTDC